MKLRNQSCQLILGHYKLRNQSCQLILGHYKFQSLEFYFQGLEFFSQRIGKKVSSLEKDRNKSTI